MALSKRTLAKFCPFLNLDNGNTRGSLDGPLPQSSRRNVSDSDATVSTDPGRILGAFRVSSGTRAEWLLSPTPSHQPERGAGRVPGRGSGSHLLQLILSGEAAGHRADEAGEGEGAAAIAAGQGGECEGHAGAHSQRRSREHSALSSHTCLPPWPSNMAHLCPLYARPEPAAFHAYRQTSTINPSHSLLKEPLPVALDEVPDQRLADDVVGNVVDGGGGVLPPDVIGVQGIAQVPVRTGLWVPGHG